MKNLLIASIFLLGITSQTIAQENAMATSGNAVGTGGSASYSVGQVVYTTLTGSNGSVAQGVQQPYEISIITGVSEKTIQLEMSVYPNPTTDFLKLKVESEKFESLQYQLIGLQGKVIKNATITANNTTIKMEALPKAIYFLSVTNGSKTVKTFKIIKN